MPKEKIDGWNNIDNLIEFKKIQFQSSITNIYWGIGLLFAVSTMLIFQEYRLEQINNYLILWTYVIFKILFFVGLFLLIRKAQNFHELINKTLESLYKLKDEQN